MTDIIKRLNEWLEVGEQDDADRTLRDARDEIVSLRALLARQSESAHAAIRMIGGYAERSGFLQGGLEMAAAGHTTADAVLAAAEKKFAPDTKSQIL